MGWADKFAFAPWNLIGWCVAAAIVFTLEFIGIFHGKETTTLTYLIRNTVPLWLRGAILGWMAVHFLIQK